MMFNGMRDPQTLDIALTIVQPRPFADRSPNERGYHAKGHLGRRNIRGKEGFSICKTPFLMVAKLNAKPHT